MSNRKAVQIIGGGTVSHVRSHLALCAPAYGTTARRLLGLCKERFVGMDVNLILTRMADPSNEDAPETTRELAFRVEEVTKDLTTRVVFMSAAVCDFFAIPAKDDEGLIVKDRAREWGGKHGGRLRSSDDDNVLLLRPDAKVIPRVRSVRKDIFLVGFKTTSGATQDEQHVAGLRLLKDASCNLVLANDTQTRTNMIITPEEARYHVTTSRDEALRQLVDMACLRSHLTFTQSTVIAGSPVPWDDPIVPQSLRIVVDHCIARGAYKPVGGATVGHFAYRVSETEFLTSIRKTDLNDIRRTGLVLVRTDGPDTVLAFGAKPSVGGQSQRTVFRDHPGLDCIVHFHCPLREGSRVPVRSQREFECGSHQCGENASAGLASFEGGLKSVFLDRHGPLVVFSRDIDPRAVISFIEANFDLHAHAGGLAAGPGVEVA